jgi:hypothetical protein
MIRLWGRIGLLAGCLLAACGDDPLESERRDIKIVDEAGRPVPGALVEIESGGGVLAWRSDFFGCVHIPERELIWPLRVRSIDGCPFAHVQDGSWLLQRDTEVLRRCRTYVPWKIVGEPGDSVGWREIVTGTGILDPERGRTFNWYADLSQRIALDSLGRGILRIPSLLDPFRSTSELRITMRGISFRPGWWWLDPTDSVFHAPAIVLGEAVRVDWALSGRLLWGGDTLLYSRGMSLVRIRADGSRRKATIHQGDSVLAGSWDDSPTRSFRWRFVSIEGAIDALVLDTGAGPDRGVLLRRVDP